MRTPSRLVIALAITLIGAVAVNYLVRVAESPNEPSTGILVDYIRAEGFGALALRLLAIAGVLWLLTWVVSLLKGFGITEIRRFWTLVAQYPDEAYHWFQSSPAWKVFEFSLPPGYQREVPPTEWEGPFHLAVPELGGRIYIFGRRGEYEATRGQLVKELSRS